MAKIVVIDGQGGRLGKLLVEEVKARLPQAELLAIGTNGIAVRQGYTTPDMEEASIKSLAVERSYLSYVLADSSKFGKVAAVTICPLRDACILTDRMPDEIYLSQTIIKEVD